MALIGKIRKNSWILVVMVGLGLGGFIIMDVSSAGGPGGNNTFNIGEVNGNPIDWVEFQRAEEALYQNSNIGVYDRRDYLWDYFIDQELVNEEAEEIGLIVGEDEMEELQYGVNISPVVQRNFTSPQTGQMDVQSLNEFRQGYQAGTLAPRYLRVWEFQAEEIEKERKQSKLVTIVKKGIYTPTWLAEKIQEEEGVTVDFRYVMLPYDLVEDAEIEVTDADYEAFLKANSEKYQVEEDTRDVSYVVFDVLPTPEDTVLLLEKMADLIRDFKATEEDSIFAINNLGGYDGAYLTLDQLPPVAADTVFSLDSGDVYGPYVDQGSYWAVKSLGQRAIPDSVRSRHILLSIQTQEQVAGALALADSLVGVLQEDISKFPELARQYSGDQGSAANDGDLGFVALNAFVKPMNDHLFFSDAQPGEVTRVVSQFGLHIVEVLERKFDSNTIGVRTASVREPIIPSEATQDMMYDDVLEFAGLNRTLETLTETVNNDPDLTLESFKNLKMNDYRIGDLGSGSSSRDIVQWLFDNDTKKGQVAPEVFIYEDPVNYFNAKYVVAALEDVHDAGLAEPSQVMDLIEGEVKNEKKADILLGRVSGSTLDAIAAEFDVAIDSVENVSFGTDFMRNIGDEKAVLGTSMAMDMNEVSKPIIGKNGVFVIQLTNTDSGGLAQNILRLRRQGSFQIANAADFELLTAMREEAKIKDMRNQFY